MKKKIKKKNVNFKAFFSLSFHLLYRQFNYFSPLKYLLFHKKENFKYVRGCPFKKNTRSVWNKRKIQSFQKSIIHNLCQNTDFIKKYSIIYYNWQCLQR
jgi:hypothetical protein